MLQLALALDAARGFGPGGQAGRVDRLPAALTDAVGAFARALEGLLDFGQPRLGDVADGDVELALEGDVGRVGRVLVRRGELARGRFLVARERGAVDEPDDLLGFGGALAEQLLGRRCCGPTS